MKESKINFQSILIPLVLIFYPALAYFGMKHFGVRIASLILLILVLGSYILKILKSKALAVSIIVQVGIVSIILTMSYLLREPFFMKIVPALIATSASIVFFASLLKTPIAQSFAMLRKPQLNAEELRYTRNVTIVWGVVMAGDAVICFLAALAKSMEVWLIVCFPFSYTLIGIVFCSEYVIRKWKFGEFDESVLWDKILKAAMKR